MRHTITYRYAKSEDDFAEATIRGWMRGIEVTCPDGRIREVEAYLPYRLKQDAETEFIGGTPGLYYGDTIVVPVVDRSHIEAAIAFLLTSGSWPPS